MTTIDPTYSAQFVVAAAEVKLVADQTSAAGALAIKADELNLADAQEIEVIASHEIDIIT